MKVLSLSPSTFSLTKDWLSKRHPSNFFHGSNVNLIKFLGIKFLVKNAQMMSLSPCDDIEKSPLPNCILLTLAWSLYEIVKFDSRTLFIFFQQPTPSLTFSLTDQALAEWRGVLYIYSCVCFCYPFEHSIHFTSGKTEFLTAAGVVNKVIPPLL